MNSGALVVRTRLGGVASAALTLIGDAGRKEAVQRIVPLMTGTADSYVQCGACWAAVHSGYLALALPILRTWASIHPREQGNLSLALSWLLEADFDRIADSEEFENPTEYVELVEERIAQLVSEHGDQAVLFRGSPTDVSHIAEAMLAIVESGESVLNSGSDFAQLRHRFEAMTGVDCSKFYWRGQLQPRSAAEVIRAFLASPSLTRSFVVGNRYFFGHLIPD